MNVQLVEAASDEPLWSQTYDRQLSAANVFAIPTEILAADTFASYSQGANQGLPVRRRW